MKFTLLLMACLVTTSLAWSLSGRQMEDSEVEESVESPDLVGESSEFEDVPNEDDERLEKCLRRAEKCNVPEEFQTDQSELSVQQLLRQMVDVQKEKQGKDACEDLLREILIDSVNEEEQEALTTILYVDDMCNCGELQKNVFEDEALPTSSYDSFEPNSEDVSIDSRKISGRQACLEALIDAGIVPVANDDDGDDDFDDDNVDDFDDDNDDDFDDDFDDDDDEQNSDVPIPPEERSMTLEQIIRINRIKQLIKEMKDRYQ